MVLTCPVCAFATEPAAEVGPISICGRCGASLVVDAAGTVRRATATDTEALSAVELKQLVRARSSLARPERRQR